METLTAPSTAERPLPTFESPGGRPPRICMVSFYFHPEYSGSSIQALNLSTALRQHGCESFIVSANLSGSPEHELFQGIPVHRRPVLRARDAQIPSFWLSLAWFLVRRRHEYDLIHAHGTLQHTIAGLIGRLVGKPSILKVAMADSDLAFERQGRLWGTINSLLVARFSQFIATTEAIQHEFERRQLDTGRVSLIPNGVDTSRYAPVSPAERALLRRKLGLPAGPLVTFVGIVTRRKNLDGIARIWRRLADRGLGGHLAIVGPVPGGETDPFYRELLDFIRREGLESSVSFVGHKPDPLSYLQASDAFLFPSRQEGMPNAVLEAMACGLPCLVSSGAGTDRIITEGVNGFLRDLDDEDGFADALERLFVQSDLRERIGAAARRTIVELYSLKAIAARYMSLYQDLLGSRFQRGDVR